MVPIVDKNIKQSKEDMYNIQIENIRMAGKNYFVDNILLKPVNGQYAYVSLEQLVDLDYIGEIKNPKTGMQFDDTIFIQLFNDNGSYIYSVCPIEDNCTSYTFE